MGKTTAEQECAHLVKHGIRLLLLGIPPKLICLGHVFPSPNHPEADVQRFCSWHGCEDTILDQGILLPPWTGSCMVSNGFD